MLAALLAGEGAQARQVGLAQRLQMAQHQGRDAIAAGHFDLRAGVARVHAGDELAQRQQPAAHVRRQDGARAHVGDVAAFALVKADEHFAFFHHMPHRQARAPAVAPGGAVDGRQHVGRAHFAQPPEVVFQHALLDGHLRGGVQMLHLAAAARARVQAKVRAAGAHALAAFAVHGQQAGGFPVVFLAVHVGRDDFAGQRAFDEDDFAVGAAGDTLRVHVKGLNLKPAFRERFGSQRGLRQRC